MSSQLNNKIVLLSCITYKYVFNKLDLSPSLLRDILDVLLVITVNAIANYFFSATIFCFSIIIF